MKKLVVMFALAMGFTATAQADLMVEPYLGYEMGNEEIAPEGQATSSEKTTMTDIGLRLGYYNFIGLWVALDYTAGSGKMKSDLYEDSDAKRSTAYIDVGFDLPILMRVWAGYAVKNEMKLDDIDGKAEGSGMKVGVGFTGLPFVSINLEYIKDDFTKYNGESLKDSFDKLDSTAYVLSVSLPLNF